MSGLLEKLVERVEQLERRIAELVAPMPEWQTVESYAARHAIAESTVRAAVKTGRLPAQRHGRAVRVRADVEIGLPVRVAKIVAAGEEPAAFAARALGKVRR